MADIKEIIKNIPQTAKTSGHSAQDMDELMNNPEYLRHSSNVISDALQRGFDVLQLENGDIITTGTKVIVTHYHWDANKGEMAKLSARERKKQVTEE